MAQGEFVFQLPRANPSVRPARHRSWPTIAVPSAFAFLIFTFSLAVHASASPEYRAKAQFLATFPNFIDWPDSAFPSPQSSILLCVRGDFGFGTALAEFTRGISVHGRAIEVRWVRKDEDLRACHIVFVSHSEASRYAKLLQTLEGTSVLTVGETPDFLAAGGAVSFSLQREILQFEVDLLHANKAHLRISSRLLVLARRVVTSVEAAKG
jgi:hypothetical protein